MSLSFWTDEQAIQQWRNVEMHRIAQAKGRGYVFADYQLNIAEVVRAYGLNNRNAVPADSLSYHQPKK